MRTTNTKFIIIAGLTLGGSAEATPEEDAPATSSEKATTAKPAQTENDAAVDAKAVEPDPIEALQRMGAYLRDQEQFTVRAKSETDYVLDTGQKATLEATGELQVQRPDKLHAKVTSPRKQREFISDGETFTVFSPNLGLYATVPAPGNLREVADTLTTKYGLQLPLVDLFRWGSSESDFDQITDARYIGTEKIDGVDTDHFALRQPGVDWQIWIERGDRPLPRKLLLTTTDDPARPDHELELAWDVDATQPESAFTFVPPKDSAKIAIVDVETVREQQQKQAKQERQATRTTRPTKGGTQ